jgi:hypothetical protein
MEKCVQALAGGKNTGPIKRRGQQVIHLRIFKKESYGDSFILRNHKGRWK